MRPLLKRHRVCCCGSVTLMTDGLDLISPDPAVRQNSVQNIMDRTPLGAQQYGDASVVGVRDDKFLRDHASGDVSAKYYDRCVERTIAHLRRSL
jgi:hypothetical protein